MIMPNLFNFFLAEGWGLSHQETRNKKSTEIAFDRMRTKAYGHPVLPKEQHLALWTA